MPWHRREEKTDTKTDTFLAALQNLALTMRLHMNREIARALIHEKLRKLRKLSYAELLKLVNKASTINVDGSDGKRYQIERLAFGDSKKGENIRVMVSADAGHFFAQTDILILLRHDP
jgi:hypothetical protein